MQLAGAGCGGFRIGQDRLCGDLAGFDLLDGCLGCFRLGLDAQKRQALCRDLRLGLFFGDGIVAIVERDQRIARLDALVGDDVDRIDIAGDLWRNGGDVALDVSVVGRDHEAARCPPFVAIPGTGADSGDNDDGQYEALHRAFWRCRGRSDHVVLRGFTFHRCFGFGSRGGCRELTNLSLVGGFRRGHRELFLQMFNLKTD